MSNLSLEIKFLDRRTFGLIATLGLTLLIACGRNNVERLGSAQSVATPVSTTTPAQIPQSGDTATLLTQLYEAKNCRTFFEAFPNTFVEFDRLYGYEDEKGSRQLTSVCEEHINYFLNCSEVPDREKLNKVINIGINGKWDADAIGLFQRASYDLIKSHPNEAKEILDALPDSEASSYWYFLFDGPHPGDKENIKRVNLLKDVLGKNSNQTKLLSKQYEKLMVDRTDH